MVGPVDPNSKTSQAQNLTPDQKAALGKLHDAATQFEGVFVEMLMNAMQDTVPTEGIFGPQSMAESTWQSMLNDERAQQMAKGGSFGLAQQLESQLKDQVLGDASHEAHVDVDKRIEP